MVLPQRPPHSSRDRRIDRRNKDVLAPDNGIPEGAGFVIYQGALDVKSAGRCFPGSFAPRRGGGSNLSARQSRAVKAGRRPPVGEALRARAFAVGIMDDEAALRLRGRAVPRGGRVACLLQVSA